MRTPTIEGSIMFSRRAMQVKMVKTPKDAPSVSGTTTSHWHIDPEQINKIATAQMRNVAVIVVGGFAALKIVTAACEIAVNACPKN